MVLILGWLLNGVPLLVYMPLSKVLLAWLTITREIYIENNMPDMCVAISKQTSLAERVQYFIN